MLIDFHSHAFPGKIAHTAIPMMEAVSGFDAETDGTDADLKAKMKAWGVDRHVLLHIATRPGQHAKINAFAQSCLSEDTYCFGSVHPLDEGIAEILGQFREMGLSGVKLHPDYQSFFASDKEAYAVYGQCEELGLPICLHCGFDPKSPDLVHATPEMVGKAAEDFPKATFIGAHLGGMYRFGEVERFIAGKRNVYIDISMMAGHIQAGQYRRIILSHGTDRVLYGSDCPWSTPETELSALKALGLGQ
ncbi:MAG: amidohydrolase family protein, partial [Eubacteriaceae bacterium]|nr:amidohydrolase family protein [Eubacteriaceae bacterium]